MMLGLFDASISDAATIHFCEVANAYASIGHRVTVICPALPAGKSLFAPRVRVCALPFRYKENLWCASWQNILLLLKYLALAGPCYDVVHIRWRLLPSILLRIIHRLKSAGTCVLTEHNGWLGLEIMLQRRSRVMAAIGKWLQAFDARHADKVLAVTPGIRQLLMESGVRGKKIFVVGNGANTSHFRPLADREQIKRRELGIEGRVLGFIGNISKWQGIDQLVDGFVALYDRYPDLYLLIAGSGMYAAELKRRVSALPQSDRILLKPNIPYEDVNRWMNLIDIAVAPKSKKLNAVGYSPLKIRDYAAAGRPVISTNVNGIKEFEPFGWLATYDPDTPGAFTDLVDDVLSRRDLEEMGRLARSYAIEHFDWDTIARQIVDMTGLSQRR